jgi:RNA polymerase-interacting CarD/CdnL/TRCF family regulator
MHTQTSLPANVFKVGEYIYCPIFGVGEIYHQEEILFEGQSLNCYVIVPNRYSVVIKVPVEKMLQKGILHIHDFASQADIAAAMKIMVGKRQIHRQNPTERSRQLENKLRSSLQSVAEIIRDTCADKDEDWAPSYTYGELGREALRRLIDMIAVVENIDQLTAREKVEKKLATTKQLPVW